MELNEYVKSERIPILDSQIFGIHYIKLTDIFHGQKCTNLFDIIKKFFNDIKKYAKIEDTLNEINSITNHEIIGSNLKKFNIEEYFALKKISNKFANPQELLFIIDFFSKNMTY